MASTERLKRLSQALPPVSALLTAGPAAYKNESDTVWMNLSRGLGDVKKDVALLDSMDVPEGAIADVWEFVLRVIEERPKYAARVMAAVATLLESRRWADGFLNTTNKQRLALWKLSCPAETQPSPVALTLSLVRLGVEFDDLLPTAVVGNSATFVKEFVDLLDPQELSRFELSELGCCWRASRAARQGLPEDALGLPDRGGGFSRDFTPAARANGADAGAFEAASRRDQRPVSRKDIVDQLLDVTIEALDVAAKCIEPMLCGYEGELNIAACAKSKVLEFRKRQQNLQAQLVVLGPYQCGKTSLAYALAGFPALPPACPSMVITRWVHTPSLAVPRLSIPQELAALLAGWWDRLAAASTVEAVARPPATSVEGIDAVAEALEQIQQLVYRGRLTGSISKQELEPLSRPSMSVSVEVAFQALVRLEESLTDTGTLSLVDLPSPDSGPLWEHQDVMNLCRRSLQEADAVMIVVDASKNEVPSWLAELLKETLLQERLLRREDAWVVANRIDQLPDFFCQDGVVTACRRAREQQLQSFKEVVLDENHVIPAAARLSLLGQHGLRQVTEHLTPQVLSRLEKVPWFAQVSAFLFGVHWEREVKNMEKPKWRQSMKELQVLGQVTGQSATPCITVLKTAYLKMLPRTVARVMFDLSQHISTFVASLGALQGSAKIINVEQLRDVFVAYEGDVQRRVTEQLKQHVPREESVRRMAASKCSQQVVLDDANSAELNENYFALLAREALGLWQPAFQASLTACCDEVTKAHQKWQRSTDHYLAQGGVDAATKQRVLLESKTLRLLPDAAGEGPLKTADRDRWVREHANQVEVTRHRQLFRATRMTFFIKPDNVLNFLLDLYSAWIEATEREIFRRCIEPVHRNFDAMVQQVEDLNMQRLASSFKRAPSSFDLGFVQQLMEVLPKVAASQPEAASDSSVVDAEEAQRCEALCEEVRAVLRKIESKQR